MKNIKNRIELKKILRNEKERKKIRVKVKRKIKNLFQKRYIIEYKYSEYTNTEGEGKYLSNLDKDISLKNERKKEDKDS
jgi:hypothetical protein